MIYSNGFSISSKIYNKLGQLNYKTKDAYNIKEYIHADPWGNKYIYIGQLKDGTNKAEGVGIRVWESGSTQYLNN